MKNYAIGLVAGILLTASALMFMGASENSDSAGKYRISGYKDGGYMLYDTHTGEMWIPNKWTRASYWVQYIGPNEMYDSKDDYKKKIKE